MKYFIIAGEASGDLHASRLIHALKQVDSNATFVGFGGDFMKKNGCEILQHYKNMAFMGIVNVLLNIKKIKANITLCKTEIIKQCPDAIILIDYPGFNLRIAEWTKKSLPHIPIHYYIAPKLWAWKSYRIKTIKKYIDKMYTIFPFETDYFKTKGYNVTYVGNPCVDAIREFKKNITPLDEFKSKYHLDDRPIIALLPGSRKQEIKGCLKTMAAMADRFPSYQFVISGAPSIPQEYYYSISNTNLPIISSDTYNLLEHSHAAVVNSGTATLETALIGTPQVVVYHVFGGFLANILQKILLHIPYVSLVNLIGEGEVAKELIARHFTVDNLRRELHLISNSNVVRNKILSEYIKIQSRLGNNNTAELCAIHLWNNLNNKE